MMRTTLLALLCTMTLLTACAQKTIHKATADDYLKPAAHKTYPLLRVPPGVPALKQEPYYALPDRHKPYSASPAPDLLTRPPHLPTPNNITNRS